jgi:hypothetical protein
MPKNMKRILTVSIVTMHDDNPDTSYLGEYANNPTSKFSIDRSHDSDCPQQTYNKPDVSHLERIHDYLCGQYNKQLKGAEFERGEYADWYDDSSDFINEHIDAVSEECTCGRGSWNHREYQFFNPSSNYVDSNDNLHDDITANEVIKYVAQDYARMEDLGNGWNYIGIRAEAIINLGQSSIDQTITSGGVWGIESDCDYSDIKQEELSELRSQLKALGFSTRAISKAFKKGW